MENRSGLVVSIAVSSATGRAEREALIELVDDALEGSCRITPDADNGDHTSEFHAQRRARNVMPQVGAREDSKPDARTTRHAGDTSGQRLRKSIA